MTIPHGWIESKTGDRFHYVNGKLHNDDGPAVIHADGTQSWYIDDNLHRLDGPAIHLSNGSKVWYKHGKRHREDGPAYISSYIIGYYYNGILINVNDDLGFLAFIKFKCFL